MKPKVYIRTDGSPEIGLGHVVRCISLAHMLRNDFDIQFFILNAKAVVESLVTENGFVLNSIETEDTFFRQINETVIVVLDGYHFTTSYQQKVKAVGAKLLCIDDLHQIHFVADFVLNHAPGVSKSAYSAEPYTEYLLGPDYALIRPEFLTQDKSLRIHNEENKTILICFGGSDFKDLTSKTLSWIDYSEFHITVVTGAAYIHEAALEKVMKEKAQFSITLKKNLKADEMWQTISENQISIVPASGILFETVAVGSRAISGYYVDNQMDVYNGFLSKALFYDAKDFSKSHFKMALEMAINDKSMDIYRKQMECIDGKSPERIIKKLLSLC